MYRKTWFGYALWAVYAGLCIISLVSLGFALYFEYISASMAGFGCFLIFPVAVGAYWAIREAAQYCRKKYTIHTHTVQMLEAFLVAFSLVFGTVCRLVSVLSAESYFRLSFSQPAGIRDLVEVPYATYYDMALVRTGEQITPLVHGAGYLYVLCLSAFCSFLGNRLVSAVLFEAFLQIMSLLLGYLAVRKAAGRLAACFVLLFLSFSETYMLEMYNIAPNDLIFLLYLAGLLLIVAYSGHYRDGRLRKSAAFCGAVSVGAVTGILTCLDLRLVVLLLFLIGLFGGGKARREGEKAPHTVRQSIGVLVVTLLSCAAGVCLMWGAAALARGVTWTEAVAQWLTLYRVQGSVDFLYSSRANVVPDLLLLAFITAAAAFLVFEFYRDGGDRGYMLWILICILTAPTPVYSYGVLYCPMIALFQWCVLAGLGLRGCLFGGAAQVVQAKIEQINASAPALPTDGGQTQEKPRFLENPLPLPKKHVKKEMDYQYPVAEQDMHYDIAVDENDDYDIL